MRLRQSWLYDDGAAVGEGLEASAAVVGERMASVQQLAGDNIGCRELQICRSFDDRWAPAQSLRATGMSPTINMSNFAGRQESFRPSFTGGRTKWPGRSIP